jgi:hypothetical protein
VDDITPDGVVLTDRQGKVKTIPYDTLVISRGREKNDALFEEIEGQVSEVYKIGDCDSAGNILKAVWSANEIARKI